MGQVGEKATDIYDRMYVTNNVRSWRDMESATLPCGGGWRGRSLSVVGNERSRELCEALELAPTTLQAASLPVLHQQPQQANCCHDQHHNDAPRR
jgi:hypothetical protein